DLGQRGLGGFQFVSRDNGHGSAPSFISSKGGRRKRARKMDDRRAFVWWIECTGHLSDGQENNGGRESIRGTTPQCVASLPFDAPQHRDSCSPPFLLRRLCTDVPDRLVSAIPTDLRRLHVC